MKIYSFLQIFFAHLHLISIQKINHANFDCHQENHRATLNGYSDEIIQSPKARSDSKFECEPTGYTPFDSFIKP